MALDMSDILNMEAAQNLASIPRNMQTDRMLEEQNEAIRSQNATILKLREQNKQLREKFYELMDDRDGWQAQALALKDGINEYVDKEKFEEVKEFVNTSWEKHREEVHEKNRS